MKEKINKLEKIKNQKLILKKVLFIYFKLQILQKILYIKLEELKI